MDLFARRFYARMVSEMFAARDLRGEPLLRRLGQGHAVQPLLRHHHRRTRRCRTLIGGFTILLQILAAMVLVSLYHPLFLIFNMVVGFFVWLIWRIWGPRAIAAPSSVSHRKHAVARLARRARRVQRLLQVRAAHRARAATETDERHPHYVDQHGDTSELLHADAVVPVHLCLRERAAARPRRLAGDPGAADPRPARRGGAGAVGRLRRHLAARHLPELLLRPLRLHRRAVAVLRRRAGADHREAERPSATDATLDDSGRARRRARPRHGLRLRDPERRAGARSTPTTTRAAPVHGLLMRHEIAARRHHGRSAASTSWRARA